MTQSSRCVPPVCLLLLLLVVSCGKKTISFNSDFNHVALPKVDTEPYGPVQKRAQTEQNPELALGISISGGGSRAQYFGVGVLLGLEEIQSPYQNSNFLQEADYFSTVSGGCYAAGYYLTIKKNLLNSTGQTFRSFYFGRGEKFKDFVGKSASPVQILSNNKNEKGSSYPMTERLDYEVLQYDSDPSNANKFHRQMMIGHFFVKKESAQAAELPMFVPNGTIFHNGERLPFMPHILESLSIESSLDPNQASIAHNANGVSDGYSLPLTYAVTASSAFPGVLPKTKFGIKGSDKVLCVIDGGAVDNFGFTTLFELLESDKVKQANKKALIIDCSGEGAIERLSEPGTIGLGTLLETTSLLTVQTRYINMQNGIKSQALASNIPAANIEIVSFSTIREHLRNLKKDNEYQQFKANMAGLKDTNKNWFKLYVAFRDKLIQTIGQDAFLKDENNQIILSSLDSGKFGLLSPSDILLLYEYSAQVKTKLKIYADEREMLILAGRYAAYLNKDKLGALLKAQK